MRVVFILSLCVVLLSGCSRSKAGKSSSQSQGTSTPGTPAKSSLPSLADVSRQFRDASKARIEGTYAIVILADGNRTMTPLASLSPIDLAWLTELARTSPLAKGKSSVVVVASTEPAKKTIQVAKNEGDVETVQLCPPNIIRDQIGGTCMIYARVHWLDIAGYPVDQGTIYKIINNAPPEKPWRSPAYVAGLTGILKGFKSKPVVHDVPPEANPFDWARSELRKGRPILAALPREIWQALPPGFVAAHPWNGGSVGHQIVLNGFTWNPNTRKGTFHVINSWNELMEFDLGTDVADDRLLVIEQSMSPLGEVQEQKVKETVRRITYIKSVGSTNLYEVETNLGMRRVAAPSEEKIRSLIEESQ